MVNVPDQEAQCFSLTSAQTTLHIQHKRGLSPRTVKCYSSWLAIYQHWVDTQASPYGEKCEDTIENRFNITILRRYLYAKSQTGVRPRTIRSAFYSLRALGVFLVEQWMVNANPVNALKMPKKNEANHPVVSRDEVIQLIDAIERLNSARKTAMGRVMLMTLA